MITHVITENDFTHLHMIHFSFLNERGNILYTIGSNINGQYMHIVILTDNLWDKPSK